MKKRIVRITAALCAAALLAGCGGSISSKDGGYYTTEAAAQESYNYDSAAGSVDSGLVPENAAEAATDETAQKIIYNASLSMESTDFDTTREALMTAVEANGAWLESTTYTAPRKTMTVPPTTPCGCRWAATARFWPPWATRAACSTSARAPRTSRAAT